MGVDGWGEEEGYFREEKKKTSPQKDASCEAIQPG